MELLVRGIRFGLITCLLLFPTGCYEQDGSDRTHSLVSPSLKPSSVSSAAAVENVGPLSGETWPAGSVPVNSLLHDDGRDLWAYKLSGKRVHLWRHPRAHVDEIAASPQGKELALSVFLPARRGQSLSSVLYHLASDGSVTAVDSVRHFFVLESPLFLTPPTRIKAPARLYWLRFGEEVDSRGRLDTSVMTMSRGEPVEVRVPLRFAEAVFQFDGYTGAAIFSLSLIRQNNVPTRLDVLVNTDYSGSTDSNLTLWGDNEHRADTDALLGTAWLSPEDYVIPMVNETHRNQFSLRLFRKDCEVHGSHVIYKGPKIDLGWEEVPWEVLPGGSDQVLVLGTKHVTKIVNEKKDSAPWLSVDVKTGEINRTGVRWRQGAWTWVSPKLPVQPRKQTRCGEYPWVWP